MFAWLSVALSRISALFSGSKLDEDFDDEVRAHIEMLTEDSLRRGMTPEAARRAAGVRFGGPMQGKEQQRDQRGMPLGGTMRQDMRYALRGLRKYPAFSFVAVTTLAIGIGAGTAVFTFVRAVLLRPLPYQNPQELVRLYETNPLRGWTKNVVAPANWADWR